MGANSQCHTPPTLRWEKTWYYFKLVIEKVKVANVRKRNNTL
jgi:hypothetical protein